MRTLRALIHSCSRGAALFALVLALGGCKSPASRTSAGPSSDRIVQLNVITVPVALDLDGLAGADGVAVKLYANEARRPKAVRIPDGTLELLMFDGTFYGLTNVPPPLRVFSYTARELRAHEFRSSIGYGYEFTLRWMTNVPTQRIMSIAARYTHPEGGIITSRPSSVTVLNR